MPTMTPALLRGCGRHVLRSFPELQEPVIRRDRSARVLFLWQLHTAQRVVLEQPRTIRQPLAHGPVDHLAKLLDLALDRPGSYRCRSAVPRVRNGRVLTPVLACRCSQDA